MSLSIQPVEPADLSRVAALNIQLQKDEGSVPMTQVAAEARLAGWLEDGYRGCLIHEGGELAGYVLYRSTDPDSEGHPGGLFVRQFLIVPGHRRRGLGTAAFRFFTEEIAGQAPILLDVMVTNPDARRFWSTLGFREYSIRLERDG